MVDWAEWARRWEAQQQFHIPRREQRFTVMLELVAEVLGETPRVVLDLACGPGSIAARLLARFPATNVVALDADPLVLEIGRRTLRDADGRLQWVQADLRTTDWTRALEQWAPFDAVLTMTAMHWLAASDLVRVYGDLGRLVRPGGIYLNAEHLRPTTAGSRLGEAARSLRSRLGRKQNAEGESWDQWWEAAIGEPAFADLLAERAQVFNEVHPRHDEYVTAS